MTHRICRERGWSLSMFEKLPEDEQIELLAYDTYRQRHFNDLIDQMSKKYTLSKTTPTESNRLTPEVLTLLMLAQL